MEGAWKSLGPTGSAFGHTRFQIRRPLDPLVMSHSSRRQWAVCLQKRDFAQAQARRQLPTLALVTTRRHGGRLLLEAPGMEPLSVPLNPPLDRATGVTRTNIK